VVRLLFIGTFIAATSAGAQFTTLTSMPKREARAAAAAQQQQAAQQRTDSVQRAALVDMKTWVDSVAGSLAVTIDSGQQDTTRRAPPPPRATTPPPTTTDSATAAGVRAPATATWTPFMAIVGGMLVLVGLVARRRARA
jgi:hypothetical protein